MKINCSYCGCAFEATEEKCPHCGGVNDQAANYANQVENELKAKEQAKVEAQTSFQNTRKKMIKTVYIIYGVIAFCICLPILIGIILGIFNSVREGKERIENERIRQEQSQEEERKKAEMEKESKEYDESIVAVSGVDTVAVKDRYYEIQVTEVVPYELHYDHNEMDWGANVTNDPYLADDEHRLAIHIRVKNCQDKVSIYGDPSQMMKLYIEDENANSIVIQEDDLLNGSSDDNYYSGGMMISDNHFSDNYGETLEKNQTMSWWVPVVVNESSERIVLHFDYHMSITVENPYANTK